MRTKDYTKMLKGAKSERGEPIKVCPKCGRKGAYSAPRNLSNGRSLGESYLHVAELYDGSEGTGISMRVSKETCWITPAPATSDTSGSK